MKTNRLILKPFSREDFHLFVEIMLTDPKVVEFFYSYKNNGDLASLYAQAEKDFWEHFEQSRADTDFEVFSIYLLNSQGLQHKDRFIGWAGLLQTELSEKYIGPELQFMFASAVFGKGYATEAAGKVLQDAISKNLSNRIIATVDIPNKASIRVLEKAGLKRDAQIEAYGCTEMYLYSVDFG